MGKSIKKFLLPMCFILDSNQNILLLKRKDRQTREPVKGGIEIGEEPQQAIIREIYEETGISQNCFSKFNYHGEFITNIEKSDFILERHLYIFFLSLAEIKPKIQINFVNEGGEDHCDYGWFDFEELESLEMDYKEEQMGFIKELLYNFNG